MLGVDSWPAINPAIPILLIKGTNKNFSISDVHDA